MRNSWSQLSGTSSSSMISRVSLLSDGADGGVLSVNGRCGSPSPKGDFSSWEEAATSVGFEGVVWTFKIAADATSAGLSSVPTCHASLVHVLTIRVGKSPFLMPARTSVSVQALV